MARAIERTAMVTETVEVEKLVGITLELSLEEAYHVAALAGAVHGFKERPGRAVADSLWQVLNETLRQPNEYGFQSILSVPGYVEARDSYKKIAIEA